jgi:hypothetical protein
MEELNTICWCLESRNIRLIVSAVADHNTLSDGAAQERSKLAEDATRVCEAIAPPPCSRFVYQATGGQSGNPLRQWYESYGFIGSTRTVGHDDNKDDPSGYKLLSPPV